jgi:hypothetical protein
MHAMKIPPPFNDIGTLQFDSKGNVRLVPSNRYELQSELVESQSSIYLLRLNKGLIRV